MSTIKIKGKFPNLPLHEIISISSKTIVRIMDSYITYWEDEGFTPIPLAQSSIDKIFDRVWYEIDITGYEWHMTNLGFNEELP